MNGPQDASASQSASPGDRLPLIPLGSRVRVNGSLPYLKTADPMPMLRPPDLIDAGETGVVVELRALGIRAVRFRRCGGTDVCRRKPTRIISDVSNLQTG